MLWERHQADELPYVNMTPMVDVILCLLIFFMTATQLYEWDENQFNVAVPEVDEAKPLTAAPEDLEITVLGKGKARLDGVDHGLDSLSRLLKEARDRYADQGVIVRGNADLSYQDVADVLSVCERARLKNVRLAVRLRAGATSATKPIK